MGFDSPIHTCMVSFPFENSGSKFIQTLYLRVIFTDRQNCLFMFVYWSLTSPFVTVMDISATDRNPEPGDNPLLFSTYSKGSFRCTQPQTVMHTTKPLLQTVTLGTTGICPHRSNQPTQDSNPGPSDHEWQTLCVSPPSEDSYTLLINICIE